LAFLAPTRERNSSCSPAFLEPRDPPPRTGKRRCAKSLDAAHRCSSPPASGARFRQARSRCLPQTRRRRPRRSMKSRCHFNDARRACGNCVRMSRAHFRRHPGRNDHQSHYFRHQIPPRQTPGLTLSPKDRTWKITEEDACVRTRFVFLTFYEMQTLLRALIVDSEAPARELLQDMLATHRNVRVVGEANSAPTAVSLYED
jgi:hypothetical protein